jgi:dTMP kinase
VTGPSPADRGRFITIEGPEGAGKTTQAARLVGFLGAAGSSVIATREPGGTDLGERIRVLLLARGTAAASDPIADALLFSAARRQLVHDVIRPGLGAGATIVCTRFADSTLAYQGYGAGVPLADLRWLEELATGGIRPDLTIVLDVPPEVGLGRKAPDDQTRFELEYDLDFHRRVREGFLALAAAAPDRFAVVDASRGADEVWEDVRQSVTRFLRGERASGEPERHPERIQP